MERPDFKSDFVYTVDFRPVKHYRDLYKCIKNGLDLPDFFGENRDALWDCLTGFIRCPCDIRFSGISSLSKQRRAELQKILDVFTEAEKENPDEFRILYID